MRHIFLVGVLAFAPLDATSQTADVPVTEQAVEKDKITSWLQSSLSGSGRDVQIDGFVGALSAQASFTSLTIADDQGIWLTITDAALDWNRSALLKGRLEINALTAAKIDLQRIPKSDETLPSTTARDISLPDLPVAVQVAKLEAAEVVLGKDVFGTSLTAQVAAALSLEGGAGTATLEIQRTDGPKAHLKLDAGYDNTTEQLDLSLEVAEPAGGIAATLIDLPGLPSVRLQIEGAGPIAEYLANLSLDTDEQPRLAGTFRLTAEPGNGPAARAFALDLRGNLEPLFPLEYQPFFGTETRLALTGSRQEDGQLEISELALQSNDLDLTGSLKLAADNLPEAFDLRGTIGAAGRAATLLPLPGSPTHIGSADIQATYLAGATDKWTLTSSFVGLERQELSASAGSLTATGTIARANNGSGRSVTGTVQSDLTGLTLADPDLAMAIGDTAELSADVIWTEGAGVQIDAIDLRAGGARFAGNATIDGLDGNGRIDTVLAVNAPELQRFSGIAGLPLDGAATAGLAGWYQILGGAFDLTVNAKTKGLNLPDNAAMALVEGDGSFAGRVQRNSDGTDLSDVTLQTEAIKAGLSGHLAAEAAELNLSAELDSLSRLLPRIEGPVTISGDVALANASWQVDLRALGPDGVDLRGTGTASADAKRLDLGLKGDIPLALVRDYLPEGASLNGLARLDIAVQGPPEVASVSGTITTRGADAALANAGITLPGIDATVTVNPADAPAIEGKAPLIRARIDTVLTNPILPSPDLTGPLGDRLQASVLATVMDTDTLRLDDIRLDAGPITGSGNAGITNMTSQLRIDGNAEIASSALEKFATLPGQPLAGTVAVTINGWAVPGSGQAEATIDAQTMGVRLREKLMDVLAGGNGRFSGKLRQDQGQIFIDTADLSAGAVTATASGNIGPDSGTLSLSGRLDNLARLVPEIPGPATVNGRVDRLANGWGLDLNATGPGGINLGAVGSLGAGGTADIRITGDAPLGLANAYLGDAANLQGPARFDLSLKGRPSAEALSGTITINNARAVLPSVGAALTDINATASLASGSARIEARSNVDGGGKITANGQVSLVPAYNSNIDLTLNKVNFAQAPLYKTQVSGKLALTGPLTNGPLLAGTLNLAETELRLAATGGSSDLPDITHVGSSPASRVTRSWAGLDGTASGKSGGGAVRLNILINAPNRIFIRGRGLDAELGGSLRLGGTTSETVPIGGFSLIRGRLDILGKRLDMEEGSLRLRGSFDPSFRLVARSQLPDATVRIVTEGTASAPVVSFTSEPDMPEDEILSLLLFGREITKISALQAIQLASAVATLAGSGGDGVIGSIRSRFGVDDLDVTTDETGGVAVTAGKYISKNTYADVTVSPTGKSEINLNLDISPSITARGSAGSDGETSLGLFFEKDY